MSVKELIVRIQFCQAKVFIEYFLIFFNEFKTCNKCAKALKYSGTNPKLKKVLSKI